MHDHIYQVFEFELAVEDAAAAAATFAIEGPAPGIRFNMAEMAVVVDSRVGAGGTPTLAAVLQGSLDGFQTAGIIESILTVQQDTAAGSTDNARKETSTPTLFGKDMRVVVTADAASGDVTYTGRVIVSLFRD
jgi:hypothetical protein